MSPARTRQNLVLAATILASGMAAIDATAVNVALPVLQKEFGASVTQIQWIIEAYALFLAALLLVGGSFGDVLGRRKTFAFGTAALQSRYRRDCARPYAHHGCAPNGNRDRSYALPPPLRPASVRCPKGHPPYADGAFPALRCRNLHPAPEQFF